MYQGYATPLIGGQQLTETEVQLLNTLVTHFSRRSATERCVNGQTNAKIIHFRQIIHEIKC